ncbi:hypothetical protein HY992_06135 [Candidatus Micrarchaeota archaeon]|nr:hypothetical protein [Candidatus Micrarchaeota archaeon]
MGDTTKAAISIAKVLIGFGVGALLAWQWALMRMDGSPQTTDDWLTLVGVAVVVTVVVYLLLHKLGKTGSD